MLRFLPSIKIGMRLRPQALQAGSVLGRSPLRGRALFGFFATASLIVVSNSGQAQTYTPVGPRYPGETILSERVITQTAERLPSPQRGMQVSSRTRSQSVPTLSVAGQEPNSLSDGGLQSEAPLANQPPLFALGHDVWKRMLDLERENADLQASLEYERKLATYMESSEKAQEGLVAEILQLREELELVERERVRYIRQSEEMRDKATRANLEYEQKLAQMKRELAMAKTQQKAKADVDAIPKSKKPADGNDTGSREKSSAIRRASPSSKAAGRPKANQKDAPKAAKPSKDEASSAKNSPASAKDRHRDQRDRRLIDNLPMPEPEPNPTDFPAPKTGLPVPAEVPSTNELPPPAVEKTDSSLKASTGNPQSTKTNTAKTGPKSPKKKVKAEIVLAVLPVGFELGDSSNELPLPKSKPKKLSDRQADTKAPSESQADAPEPVGPAAK